MIDLTTITPDNIRALSWRQPYGMLMPPPYNKIETRTWDTKWRGYVLICASKKDYSIEEVEEISGKIQSTRVFKALYEQTFIYNLIATDIGTDESVIKEKIFHNGHAIAVGRLKDSYPMNVLHQDETFVQYHKDLFEHLYKDVTPIQPFPFKGSQGFKKLTMEEIAKIKLL